MPDVLRPGHPHAAARRAHRALRCPLRRFILKKRDPLPVVVTPQPGGRCGVQPARRVEERAQRRVLYVGPLRRRLHLGELAIRQHDDPLLSAKDDPAIRCLGCADDAHRRPAVCPEHLTPDGLAHREKPAIGSAHPQPARAIAMRKIPAHRRRQHAGRRLSRERLRTHSVEAHDIVEHREPHVAVRRLRDRGDVSGHEPVRRLPDALEKIAINLRRERRGLLGACRSRDGKHDARDQRAQEPACGAGGRPHWSVGRVYHSGKIMSPKRGSRRAMKEWVSSSSPASERGPKVGQTVGR